MKLEDVRIGKQYLCAYGRNVFIGEATALLGGGEILEVKIKIDKVISHDWGYDPAGKMTKYYAQNMSEIADPVDVLKEML